MAEIDFDGLQCAKSVGELTDYQTKGMTLLSGKKVGG